MTYEDVHSAITHINQFDFSLTQVISMKINFDWWLYLADIWLSALLGSNTWLDVIYIWQNNKNVFIYSIKRTRKLKEDKRKQQVGIRVYYGFEANSTCL